MAWLNVSLSLLRACLRRLGNDEGELDYNPGGKTQPETSTIEDFDSYDHFLIC